MSRQEESWNWVVEILMIIISVVGRKFYKYDGLSYVMEDLKVVIVHESCYDLCWKALWCFMLFWTTYVGKHGWKWVVDA